MDTTRPGPLRVAVTTLGCKVNYAEMAELTGELAAAGCDVVAEDESADVRVLNSCTVTLQADATTRQRLARLRRDDPAAHIVLTGCSVDGNPGRYLVTNSDGVRLPVTGVDAVFSNAEKPRVAAHILALANEPIAVESRSTGATPAPLRSRFFLKVQDGCNHRCTYCIVWRARGASVSLPLDSLRDTAVRAVDQGFREIVLTGVDLGSYGRDGEGRLSSLIESLLDAVGASARLRLSSINANDITSDLIALNAHPKLCGHWHIPLQSGSDPVLKRMHRGYRREQYMRVCNQLRTRDPSTEITSDIMVGFPGETDDDHHATLDVVNSVGFFGAHVFRYSPRPDTPAADMTRVDDATARVRSADVRRAAELTRRAGLQRGLGRDHEVIWDSVTPDRAHGVSATYHEIVATPGANTQPGGMQRVRATHVVDEALHGTLVRDE